MTIKTAALLHPGEMGSAIGACLVRRGLRVVWASSGRSAETRSRALAAGFEDLGSVERALSAADLALHLEDHRHHRAGRCLRRHAEPS